MLTILNSEINEYDLVPIEKWYETKETEPYLSFKDLAFLGLRCGTYFKTLAHFEKFNKEKTADDLSFIEYCTDKSELFLSALVSYCAHNNIRDSEIENIKLLVDYMYRSLFSSSIKKYESKCLEISESDCNFCTAIEQVFLKYAKKYFQQKI